MLFALVLLLATAPKPPLINEADGFWSRVTLCFSGATLGDPGAGDRAGCPACVGACAGALPGAPELSWTPSSRILALTLGRSETAQPTLPARRVRAEKTPRAPPRAA